MMNMPAMDVTQVISFFADLLGKSKAAFDSAGIMGKIFYGITTVILKGLNLLGSWISQIADWLCGLMGGTVPSSPNWTYGKLLIFAAISAVILWGVRKIWRRIRGTNYSYYESISIDEQKKLLKSIKEDSRMFTRMQMLTEADGNSAQQNKPTILGKLYKWIIGAKDTSLEILQSLGRDVFRTKDMDPYKRRAELGFDNLIRNSSEGVRSFLDAVGATNQNTFINKACNWAYANSHITRNLLNGSLFVMFPALTSIWFGGRALTAQALKSQRVQQFIKARIMKPSGDKPEKYSATLNFLAKIVYKNPYSNQVNSKQQAFENLKTEISKYVNEVGGIRKVFTAQNIGKVLSTSIRASVSGAVSGTKALYKSGKWGALQGAKLAKNTISSAGKTALGVAQGFTKDMYASYGSPVDKDPNKRRTFTQVIGDKMGDLSANIGSFLNGRRVKNAERKANADLERAATATNPEEEKAKAAARAQADRDAKAARIRALDSRTAANDAATANKIKNIEKNSERDVNELRKNQEINSQGGGQNKK